MVSPRTVLALAATLLLGPCGQLRADPSAAPQGSGHDAARDAAAAAPAPAAPTPPPLFADLGSYHRGVSTRSEQAQRYFDQGLRLLFAFNLDEAQSAFTEATRLDPECALCFWGLGMSLGPHVNLPATPERTVAGHRAAEQAAAVATHGTAVEQALIAALGKRYADPAPTTPDGQHALDQAYSDAMRAVAARYPEDDDVAALTAEALMDLHPWDYWGATGDAKEGTADVLRLLEGVLQRNPNHPGANHYYIHAVEASSHPERALPSADRLAALMPGQGHMVHMPSHAYARVGRYAEAAEANRKAIAVDDAYHAQRKDQGFYMMYVAHNHQFLWWMALTEGRSQEALEQARAMIAIMPPDMLKNMQGADIVLGYRLWTLLRIGRYEAALAEPAPPADFPWSVATFHAARAIAYARLGKTAEAGKEAAAMAQASGGITADAVEGLNPAQLSYSVANGLAQGEIARAEGRHADAEKLLRAAVATEASLRYDEPPDWYTPASNFLGEFLLARGRAADAQAAYEDGLRRNPENGWALAGLAKALRAQKRNGEARAVDARLAKAWAQADLAAPASR
jgi:tetratricopeptide (TPR) repeat protein